MPGACSPQRLWIVRAEKILAAARLHSRLHHFDVMANTGRNRLPAFLRGVPIGASPLGGDIAGYPNGG